MSAARTSRSRRALTWLAVAPLAFGTAGALSLATASAALAVAPPPAGSYSGSAAVALVDADLLDGGPTLYLAKAHLAPALAEVNSAGLTTGGNTHASSINLRAQLAAGVLPLNVLVSADQKAPADNVKETVSGPLVPVHAAPVATADVATARAHARWFGDACPPVTTPLAQASSEVVNAAVGPSAPGTGTILTTDNGNGGTVYTRSTVQPITVAHQTGLGLTSTALTQLTTVKLLGGAFTVDVLSPPVISATATGAPGGASVTYSEPILTVKQGSTVIATLDAAHPTVALPASPIPGVTLTLGHLTKTVATDGTSASGSASLLDLTIAPPAPLPSTSAQIAAGTVSAAVPDGGITCKAVVPPPVVDNPLREARKDVSASSVNPGQTFDYLITVPNRGACTLTDVKVVDTLTEPTSPLELVSSDPAVSSHSGSSYTFDDIGPIAPNETKKVTLTFKVPSGAATGTHYANHADISALCNGQTFTQPVGIDGPVVDAPGVGPCRLSDSNKAASHTEVYRGETFNYYVHVFNTGGADCTHTKVSDTLVDGVKFVSCTANCTHEGQHVTWDLGTVKPGESRDLTVTVQAIAAPGTRLPNTADITADGPVSASPSTPGPIVGDRSVPAPPKPAVRTPFSLPSGSLSHTGASPLNALVALLLVVMAAVVRRRWDARRT